MTEPSPLNLESPAGEPPLAATLLAPWLPGFSPRQLEQLAALTAAVLDWNAKVNLVSRADAIHLPERHVLHCALMARALAEGGTPLPDGCQVVDIGTGGGFPGLPMAISYPNAQFLLVDSTAKKLKAVEDIAASLGLSNVQVLWSRAEDLHQSHADQFDVALGRAVSTLAEFWALVSPLLRRPRNPKPPNGLLYLKGGDLKAELKALPRGVRHRVWPLHPWVPRPFFETKQLVHLTRVR